MNKAPAKTLIIKIGATGDVVRTTPLLHSLEGEIHWLTSEYNAAILPGDCQKLTNVFSLEKDAGSVARYQYDLVLSMDEDPVVASLLPQLHTNQLSGIFINGKTAGYTKESSGWFDMSLVSLLGKQKADQLKFTNRKTYQELIFEMTRQKFAGQPYWINNPAANKINNMVGIEKRTGSRWQGKAWWGYDLVAEELQRQGYTIRFFGQCDTLEEYTTNIGNCGFIIAGDTLAMHIALSYNLPTVGIFTCTAPWEIYDYGSLQKVVSPLLEKSFYQRQPVAMAIEAVTIEMVMEAFSRLVHATG